jgi:hypothetical protein
MKDAKLRTSSFLVRYSLFFSFPCNGITFVLVSIKTTVMRIPFSLLLVFTLVLASCSKKQEDNTQSGVWVRIDNQSGNMLTSTAVSTVNYGDIVPGSVTDYKLITEPIIAGYCIFTIGHEQKYAGYGICGTPMPPPFEDGYYTFKVLPPDQGWFPLEVVR